MAWTEDRIERLKTLWADGLSASQIATALGDVTRNAVIGKIHRLGLSGRGGKGRVEPRPAAKAARPAERPAPAAPAPVPAAPAPASMRVAAPQPALHRALSVGNTVLKALPVEEEEAAPAAKAEVVPLRTGVTIAELGSSTCRWPLGDPAEPGFAFCGHRTEPGQPYCAQHLERAFQNRQRSKAEG